MMKQKLLANDKKSARTESRKVSPRPEYSPVPRQASKEANIPFKSTLRNIQDGSPVMKQREMISSREYNPYAKESKAKQEVKRLDLSKLFQKKTEQVEESVQGEHSEASFVVLNSYYDSHSINNVITSSHTNKHNEAAKHPSSNGMIVKQNVEPLLFDEEHSQQSDSVHHGRDNSVSNDVTNPFEFVEIKTHYLIDPDEGRNIEKMEDLINVKKQVQMNKHENDKHLQEQINILKSKVAEKEGKIKNLEITNKRLEKELMTCKEALNLSRSVEKRSKNEVLDPSANRYYKEAGPTNNRSLISARDGSISIEDDTFPKDYRKMTARGEVSRDDSHPSSINYRHTLMIMEIKQELDVIASFFVNLIDKTITSEKEKEDLKAVAHNIISYEDIKKKSRDMRDLFMKTSNSLIRSFSSFQEGKKFSAESFSKGSSSTVQGSSFLDKSWERAASEVKELKERCRLLEGKLQQVCTAYTKNVSRFEEEKSIKSHQILLINLISDGIKSLLQALCTINQTTTSKKNLLSRYTKDLSLRLASIQQHNIPNSIHQYSEKTAQQDEDLKYYERLSDIRTVISSIVSVLHDEHPSK